MGKGDRKRRHRAADRLARKIYDKQVRPQILAERLREYGFNGEVEFINASPSAEGYDITCSGCGRTAKVSRPVPAEQGALCPRCIRIASKHILGTDE